MLFLCTNFVSSQNVRHQLLGGEPSSEAIILEEAEYKLEEVTSVIDRIMVCFFFLLPTTLILLLILFLFSAKHSTVHIVRTHFSRRNITDPAIRERY